MTLTRTTLAGPLIGGIKEAQEVLDFRAEYGITAEVDVIPRDWINEALDRAVREDVRFRFGIDNSTLPQAGA